MTTSTMARFLDRFTQWAIAQKAIQAAALVGSHARGTATSDSDVDLVILADDPEQFLTERNWVRLFGEPVLEALEDYGLLKSVRVRYRDDLEVEFGIANAQWPLNSGSRQVISDGIRIFFDRRHILSGARDGAAQRPNEADAPDGPSSHVASAPWKQLNK